MIEAGFSTGCPPDGWRWRIGCPPEPHAVAGPGRSHVTTLEDFAPRFRQAFDALPQAPKTAHA